MNMGAARSGTGQSTLAFDRDRTPGQDVSEERRHEDILDQPTGLIEKTQAEKEEDNGEVWLRLREARQDNEAEESRQGRTADALEL